MGSPMSANSVLTCRDASAAMALITANVEADYKICGFSSSFIELNISPEMRLEDVIKVIRELPFSSTDCSLPMVWAQSKREKFEGFAVYTDNDTYAGRIHPSQALRDYRRSMSVDARLAVIAITPTNFSIADPKDSGMMDFVGFSTETPEIISSFFRGEI
jgi:60 kDa SS-A/Ro ribonucleoprotein